VFLSSLDVFCRLSMLVAAQPNGTQFDRNDSWEEEIQSCTNEVDLPWVNKFREIKN
jgi:hypothetical protein